MRVALAVFLSLLAACTLSPADEPCAPGERQACRADGQCRCGASCVPGTPCPDAPEGPAGCASLGNGAGVCVDVAWLTGLPRGRVPCGASSCDAATAQCVQWADGGVACAARCTANTACDSGCCSPLQDARGATLGNVCAPGPGYRCAADTPAGRSCDPPCGPDALCGSWEGAPTCLPRCGEGGACGDTCCAAEGGLAVCLPDARRCAARPVVAPACSTLDACVEVTFAAIGTRCAAGDSIEVHVRNNCGRAADVVICYERREGACACAVHRNLLPGVEPEVPSFACGATGRYLVSARGAGDPDVCHAGC